MWSNGQDAVDYLLCGNYDGAVLDIMMPKKDGLTTLKEVRDKALALPVLLLTAKSEIDDRVAGLDGGADDYLTKPFATQEMLARIRAMTRRQPQLQSGVIRFGDLSLDRSSFRLTGPKGEMRLGNRDFQILEMLLEHPSQVISTERFLEKIWGYDSDADISVVWVYLSGLRKKLGQLGACMQIRAARGVGYSLEAGQ